MPLEDFETGKGMLLQSIDSVCSPSLSHITVMGPLGTRLRELYRLLIAQGGVLERPYLECEGKGERRGRAPSVRAHSSDTLLLFPGEVHRDETGDVASTLDLCSRGSVHFNISIADILKPGSERLPFFSSRALKLSLLVAEWRSLR